MTTTNTEPTTVPARNKKWKKFAWYWAPVYCIAWFMLFFLVVIPSYYRRPDLLRIEDEHLYPEKFIGERSRRQLYELENIGVKLAGSVPHELAIKYLLGEIEKVKSAARHDLYNIDVRIQKSSGHFKLWTMASSYRNITNIIVKLARKNCTSDSYLLVNSHFDSEVGSPAAADAGLMIVTMLETLRIISISMQELKNPIIFLFNGGEESGLLASHGFITQHEWAPFCKAVINLDSAGSGGREIVFQSGPQQSWLLKYYKESVPHPFVSALAEELFQRDFIPSDTDFRIFRDFGNVPGLDLAHFHNGYVYHTQYDNFKNVERGTLQSTGDNVLALTRALANADELGRNGTHTKGNAICNDFLGLFAILYSERTGTVINLVTSLGAVITIALSLYRMTKQPKAHEKSINVYLRFLVILMVQIFTLLAATGLTLLMAVFIDIIGLSLSWYWADWISFGLYYCPMFFVMGLIPGFYITWTKKSAMALDDTISCFMHAHCLILAITCLVMTLMGIRAAFFIMIALFFYTISVYLNILASLLSKMSFVLPTHLLCQLIPYWFYTYQTFVGHKAFVPMQGRDGPNSKPELLMAAFTILTVIIFTGFILPILHKFRKSKSFISLFGILAVVFVIIAATPLGFPFRSEIAVERFYTLHTNRIIHDELGNVQKNNSGFYVQTVEPRHNLLADSVFKNAVPQKWMDKECAEEILCGLPLYNTRWLDWKNNSLWIPTNNPPYFDISTRLQLTSKQQLNSSQIRFNFTLHSSDRVVMYIDPFAGNKLIDWSFDKSILDETIKAPYFVYHVDAWVREPLEFWLVVESKSQNKYGQIMRLGVGTHFQHHTSIYTLEFVKFLDSFPKWAYATNSVAAFESWFF